MKEQKEQHEAVHQLANITQALTASTYNEDIDEITRNVERLITVTRWLQSLLGER